MLLLVHILLSLDHNQSQQQLIEVLQHLVHQQ